MSEEIKTKPRINNGLDLEKEEREITGDEWRFGAFSPPCIFEVPLEERKKYLPTGETQFGTEDFMDCVTRAYLNGMETKFNYRYRRGGFTPENKAWLETNGYVQNGEITFSDRFIAIKSGTTRQGNSLKAPADAIYKWGLIPKHLLPKVQGMTFDQYHDKTRITRAMDDLGQEFKKRFPMNYEQVYLKDLKESLLRDMHTAAGFAWPVAVDGIYPRAAGAYNHAFIAYEPLTFVFDNYEETKGDYIKQLAADYDLFNYGYRLYVSAENVPADPTGFWALVKRFVAYLRSKGMKPTQNISMSDQLYLAALASLGKDISPQEGELGCAESLTTLLREVYENKVPVMLSTIALNDFLRQNSTFFKPTLTYKPGVIIVSPTQGAKVGHCGVFAEGDKIMSNTSKNSLWEQNYTLQGWVNHYRHKQGLRIFFYEPL